MSELDKGRAADGAEPHPGAGSMPFFPGASGRPVAPPLPASPPGPSAPASSAGAPPARSAPTASAAPPVEGRIMIGDEIAEKVAVLAATEAGGVCALGSGVRVRRSGDAVTVDVGVVVEYGHVIMDVAAAVQAEVARMTGLMLGARVAAVNVSVEDVRRSPGAGSGEAGAGGAAPLPPMGTGPGAGHAL
ncbi:Asp23/Gls24 family envelope stress response protein [Actinomadura opuntiae]|uniref:Asp23/Gls24 family envelope stress response protein n=1 Tax=Actinomadura sp. OS1-43 TaxID=604315 RepID=UPI00255ACCC7|nr:Asp23/Gls24 family envelope stress response protein [Actinomadura sp. OS1-43]MDL4821401.1 Asp23/Gls24 family envelope stress response protein [Actinomadura sp. OS1-43]